MAAQQRFMRNGLPVRNQASHGERKHAASGIAQRVAYAKQRLARLPGVRVSHAASCHFREFVVNFDGTGLPAGAINAALLQHGIFGGHDLSTAFPALGQSALYAFSEVHTQEDIDLLCSTLEKVLQQ